MSTKYPQEFLDKLEAVEAKRPRTVIQHILQHGQITSQELKEIYGYNHPPRAIRDVRERGIPILTGRAKNEDGKSIAVYQFGDPEQTTGQLKKTDGRTVLSEALKRALVDKYGEKCFIYGEQTDPSILQPDHRVPYEIGGECDVTDIDSFMLLSPSANRKKSWSCEHCVNWTDKDEVFCAGCFWAYPEDYEHVAGKTEKLVELVFGDEDIEDYMKLANLSGESNVQDTIKSIIHYYLSCDE